jgi:hypothetical protein
MGADFWLRVMAPGQVVQEPRHQGPASVEFRDQPVDLWISARQPWVSCTVTPFHPAGIFFPINHFDFDLIDCRHPQTDPHKDLPPYTVLGEFV